MTTTTQDTTPGRLLALRVAIKTQTVPTPDLIDLCSRLARIERQHHTISEHLANGIGRWQPRGYMVQDIPATERAKARQKHLEGRAVRLANLIPGVSEATFQHDPRGPSITLHTRNGELVV